jgi:hypothetical protein
MIIAVSYKNLSIVNVFIVNLKPEFYQLDCF